VIYAYRNYCIRYDDLRRTLILKTMNYLSTNHCFDILIFINAFSLDLHPVNFSLFSTVYFYTPISGIGLIEKYARVRPPLWIYPDPQTRWSCDFSYSTFLFYALPLLIGRNERFLYRGAIASTICYASVTSSSLSSVALGKKDTLPYHFFRIN